MGITQYLHKPIRQQKLLDLLQQTMAKAQSNPPNPSKAPSCLATSILVAEDEASNRKLLQALLTPLCKHLSVATTGTEALELAQQRKFDVILLDIQLPHMDGAEVAQALIQDSQNPNNNTPLVAISAYLTRTQKEHLQAIGFREVLMKPITRDHLKQVLRQNDTFNEPEKAQAIDLEQCIKLTGNEKLARELITMFLQNLPDFKQQVQQYYNQERWQLLQSTLHKLHGSCQFCAIPRLAEISHRFEAALESQENMEGKYALLYRKLMEEIEAVLAAEASVFNEE
jgi:two-component system sensor histidine kinase BarA